MIADYLEEQKKQKEFQDEEEAIQIETSQLQEKRKFVAEARKRILEEDEGFGILKGALLISEVILILSFKSECAFFSSLISDPR